MRGRVIPALFTGFLLLIKPIRADAQELYDFNSLSSDVAQAIEKASNEADTVVLVTDFSVRSEPDSQLSIALTQDFANALRNRARRFTVVDRTDIDSAISSHKLPEGALYSPEITACYAAELQAAIVVSGSIEYTPGKIVLRVRVSPVHGEEGIFRQQIILDRTLAMDELMIKPAPKVAASFGEDKTVWAKDEESRRKAPPPSPGTQGYSFPMCVYCPQAQYSDAAVKAKVQGTVVLKVIIGVDGTAEKISIQQALPCGLDQQAINAVKDWKFKPATGPDGKPAAVVQNVETTFHLY